MLRQILRKKPVGHVHHDSTLHRSLNTMDLILMGIGAIIGAGVFVLTGIAAATKAGPAVVLSYFIAGIAAMLSALAYAELSASIGGTGSAYSYAFTGFGEFIAWFVGWNLILEYGMAVSTVAIGWAGYVENLLAALNIHLPEMLIKNPFEGGIINLLAVFIIVALSLLLCIGVKQSAKFNAVIVFIKLLTIAAFVMVASVNVHVSNLTHFLPFGWGGVIQGAALVFFAFVGFDALSTAVEEAINPQRSIPIAIVCSLIVCTLIYIIVSALLTGIVPYNKLDLESPVADALIQIGYRGIGGSIAAGAIAGLTTVILVMFYGLSRICLAIARDGLLPNYIAHINHRTRSPIRIILFIALITGLVAGFSPIDRAAELVNISALAAFTFVSMGVIVFRITHPDIPRPFKLPFNPIIPSLGIIFCVYLMINLPLLTWLRFIIWCVLGVGIYFLYGFKHSHLRKENKNN